MVCEHKWKNNSGSPDKPCVFCIRYPHLKVRYQCSECLLESCKFCLEKLVDIPLNFEVEPTRNCNRNEILELRILSLENKIEQIEMVLKQIPNTITKLDNLIKEKIK